MPAHLCIHMYSPTVPLSPPICRCINKAMSMHVCIICTVYVCESHFNANDIHWNGHCKVQGIVKLVIEWITLKNLFVIFFLPGSSLEFNFILILLQWTKAKEVEVDRERERSPQWRFSTIAFARISVINYCNNCCCCNDENPKCARREKDRIRWGKSESCTRRRCCRTLCR